MLIYTDGVTEARNADGEFFGINRLDEVLLERTYPCAQSLLDRCMQYLQEFTGDRAVSDDLTLLAVQVS